MGGLCAGGAGRGGAPSLAPPPAPLPTLLPGASAQSASQPAMIGAPVLALVLLGQLLTATSAQVRASLRVPAGSGIGLDFEPHNLLQLEPPGPNSEFHRRGPLRTSMAASSPPSSGEQVLVMQLNPVDTRTSRP